MGILSQVSIDVRLGKKEIIVPVACYDETRMIWSYLEDHGYEYDEDGVDRTFGDGLWWQDRRVYKLPPLPEGEEKGRKRKTAKAVTDIWKAFLGMDALESKREEN